MLKPVQKTHISFLFFIFLHVFSEKVDPFQRHVCIYLGFYIQEVNNIEIIANYCLIKLKFYTLDINECTVCGEQGLWLCICIVPNIQIFKAIFFKGLGFMGLLRLNAIFNNISVILWQSVLLVEKTGVPGENHRQSH